MADEVTQTISIAYDDGTTDDSFVDSSFTRDSSGLKMQRIMQTIGTSEEVINLGDIGAGAMLKVKNLGSNYVQLYNATGGTACIKVSAKGTLGDICQFLHDSGETLYAIANTAAVDLEIIAIKP